MGIRSLRLSTRLLLFGLLSALIVSAMTGYVLREQVRHSVWYAHAQNFNERAERVLARIQLSRDGQLRYTEPLNRDEYSGIFSGWYWRLEALSSRDGRGETLHSRSLWDGELAEGSLGLQGLRYATGPRGERLIGSRRDLSLHGMPVRLNLYGPAEPLEAELQRFDRGLLIAMAVLVTALVLATAVQLHLGLRPMARLKFAVAEAASGRLDRVGAGYGADLDPLARELDTMFERNARMAERARSHAADLSHALKKPLALLMGYSLQPGGQVAAGQVQSQIGVMNALIARHLARGGSGAGERRRLLVAERIEALMQVMQRLHQDRQLHWISEIDPLLDWRGEPTDLEEMLGNLLDNAGKWARSQVRISAARQDQRLRFVVADDGPGLEPWQIDRITQRGCRFDQEVEGHGLGLALVVDIAWTYQGTLSFHRSDVGGLAAELSLPD